MQEYIRYLKSKGYRVNGNEAELSGIVYFIRSGSIETAMGVQKTYWLELNFSRGRA